MLFDSVMETLIIIVPHFGHKFNVMLYWQTLQFFFNLPFLIASDTTSVDETDQLAGLDSEPFGETLLEPSGGEEVSETFQRKRSFLQLILQIQEMVISIEA